MARSLRLSQSEFDGLRARRGGLAGFGDQLTNSGKRSTRTKANSVLTELVAGSGSPHRTALERLERNPDLLEGHQEHYLQVRLFDWFERFHPDIYALLHATPNGGARSKKAGAEMKAEGQKRGYPDLSLDAPRGIYHGLRIEMKAGAGRPTPHQKAWLNLLFKQGYCCAAFNSFEQARDLILAYWSLPEGGRLPEQETDRWWRKD